MRGRGLRYVIAREEDPHCCCSRENPRARGFEARHDRSVRKCACVCVCPRPLASAVESLFSPQVSQDRAGFPRLLAGSRRGWLFSARGRVRPSKGVAHAGGRLATPRSPPQPPSSSPLHPSPGPRGSLPPPPPSHTSRPPANLVGPERPTHTPKPHPWGGFPRLPVRVRSWNGVVESRMRCPRALIPERPPDSCFVCGCFALCAACDLSPSSDTGGGWSSDTRWAHAA